MFAISRPTRSTASLHRLALAILVGVVVGGLSGGAAGSEVAVSAARAESPGAGHQCQCGRSCRGPSCCCSPGKRRAEAHSGPIRRPGGVLKLASLNPSARTPCLKSTPCGESGVPSSTSVGPVGRAALILADRFLLAATSRPFHGEVAGANLPARRADRLDDPPEHV